MLFILLAFLLIYGAMNFYVLWKAKTALSLPLRWYLPALLAAALMVASPILVRLAESGGMVRAARVLAWTGFSWMGVIFIFVSLSLVLDVARLVALLAGHAVRGGPAALRIPPGAAFFTLLFLTFLLSLYGASEAWTIRTEHLTVTTDKISRSSRPVKIAQISDVHLGVLVRRRRLAAILEKVKEAAPDLLVSTGDLVDGQIDELDGLSDLFMGIDPPLGKYAVTGNHEFYAGLGHSLDFTRRAGFRVLRGEGVDLGGVLGLAGVDDGQSDSFGGSAGLREAELTDSLAPGRFNVLLKHRPLIDAAACRNVDLQLSGHTHRGQIFPFSLVTGIFFPVNSGTVRTAWGCTVHVSRGSGTWGPPMRLLSPPEVTVVSIVGTGR